VDVVVGGEKSSLAAETAGEQLTATMYRNPISLEFVLLAPILKCADGAISATER
jgi:hypothetical protein